ncbi:MAG: S-layer homology domain-containing protein [Candidatus Limnocylindria bacterium]
MLTATTLLAGAPTPAGAVDGLDFVSAVNEHRADAGRPPVWLDAAVDRIAVERANQMASARSMYHDMGYIGERLDDLGVCSRLTGEIIAWSSNGTVEGFVAQWYGSDGHRTIMLRDDYTIAGGSWARGSDGNEYAVMIFVDSCGSSPGGFTDIGSSQFRNDIIWLVNAGITAGCSADRYCPRGVVTREQMASFLKRADDLGVSSRDWFRDDNRSPHEGDINRVAEADITGGCDVARFCPTSRVTRGQMASFLVRALDLPAAKRNWFWDDNASMHEDAINRLADAGITGGCASGRFCPNATVNREQMAGFLHRAFAD